MKKYHRYMLNCCIIIVCIVCIVQSGNAHAQYRRRPPQGPPRQLPPRQEPAYRTNPLFLGGVGGDLNIPIEDTDDWLDISGSLHGTLLYSVNRIMRFEMDLGYWFLQADEEAKDVDDPSLLTITGGLRYYSSPRLHIDGGLGLYRFAAWEGRINEESVDVDDQNELGLYGGIGYDAFPFDATIRLQYAAYSVKDFWDISVGVRWFFKLSE